jgi:DNA-binding CsgD family transcriptional regulator
VSRENDPHWLATPHDKEPWKIFSGGPNGRSLGDVIQRTLDQQGGQIKRPDPRIIELWKKGYNFTAIGQALDISISTASRHVNHYLPFSIIEPSVVKRVESKIIELWQRGYKYKEIALKFGICEQTVSIRVKRYAAENNIDLLTPRPNADIIELWMKGHSTREIADQLKVSPNTVCRNIRIYKEENHVILLDRHDGRSNTIDYCEQFTKFVIKVDEEVVHPMVRVYTVPVIKQTAVTW